MRRGWAGEIAITDDAVKSENKCDVSVCLSKEVAVFTALRGVDFTGTAQKMRNIKREVRGVTPQRDACIMPPDFVRKMRQASS